MPRADGLPKGWLYYARRFSARPGVKRRKDRTRGDNFEEGGRTAVFERRCGDEKLRATRPRIYFEVQHSGSR